MPDWIALLDRAAPALRAGPFAVLLGLEWLAGRAGRWRHVARNLSLLAGYVAVTATLTLTVGRPLRAWAEGAGVGLLVALPPAVALALGVLALDLLGYALHRVYHRSALLWRVHRVHHSDPDLDVSTAYRFHPLEVGLTTLAGVGVTVALGVPPEAATLYYALLSPWSMVQHAALPWPAVGGARWVLATPAVHRVHHARHLPETDTNFGAVLSVWDRLFGTWHPPRAPLPVGLDGYDDDRRQSVAGLWGDPFRPG